MWSLQNQRQSAFTCTQVSILQVLLRTLNYHAMHSGPTIVLCMLDLVSQPSRCAVSVRSVCCRCESSHAHPSGVWSRCLMQFSMIRLRSIYICMRVFSATLFMMTPAIRLTTASTSSQPMQRTFLHGRDPLAVCCDGSPGNLSARQPSKDF